jgi:hypothetical protein
VQPERLPSLARRERERPREVRAAELVQLPRLEPVAPITKAADPVVVELKPRPRIVFLEVVRNDTEDVVGLRPIYEDEA